MYPAIVVDDRVHFPALGLMLKIASACPHEMQTSGCQQVRVLKSACSIGTLGVAFSASSQRPWLRRFRPALSSSRMRCLAVPHQVRERRVCVPSRPSAPGPPRPTPGTVGDRERSVVQHRASQAILRRSDYQNVPFPSPSRFPCPPGLEEMYALHFHPTTSATAAGHPLSGRF